MFSRDGISLVLAGERPEAVVDVFLEIGFELGVLAVLRPRVRRGFRLATASAGFSPSGAASVPPGSGSTSGTRSGASSSSSRSGFSESSSSMTSIELQVGQGQKLDGLLEGGGEDELLDLPLVESLLEDHASVPDYRRKSSPR